MKFTGAVIREQRTKFAVVNVRPSVISNRTEAENLERYLCPVFGGIPIVLMAQDSRGVPTFRGRKDIVSFLAKVPLHAIRWKKYTLN
jgi:hypothetical protein